jgi:preprotein translocase subunit SecD
MWPHKKINLGLDLQGGMHLVLEVDTEKAVEDAIERIAQELRSSLRKDRVRVLSLDRILGTQISTRIVGKVSIDQFYKTLDTDFKEMRIRSESEADDTLTVVIDLPDQEADQIKRLATDQALETIRNRIDQFGVSEPDIRNQGQNRILIQLPGIKDTKRAKKLIGRTALLEFKLLDETNDIGIALQGTVPPESEILYEDNEDPTTNRITKTPYLVK